MAARCKGVGLGRNAFGMVTDPAVFNSVFLMAALWCIAPCVNGYYRSRLPPRIGQGVLVVSLILMQAMLSLTNTQPPLPTLLPVAALLVLEVARRAAQQCQAADPVLRIHPSTGWLATLLLALYFVASILVPDMASLPYSAFVRVVGARGVTTIERFNSPSMADMIVPRDPQYVRSVNDGCELLRSHSKPSDRMVTMDLCNPFSFALQRVPPKGDALWWALNSFSRRFHPDPERVFSEADIVMVPKESITDPLENQPIDVYGLFIHDHYALAAESPFWKLYRRRPNSSLAP
jgi:hypothetical protein